MSEFFQVVAQALNGFLDITNQVIGIMIAWTILDVPLLFILATYDFLKTLLTELGIIQEEDDAPPLYPPQNFRSSSLETDLDDIISIEISELAKRKKRPITPEEEEKITRRVMRLYGNREE